MADAGQQEKGIDPKILKPTVILNLIRTWNPINENY